MKFLGRVVIGIAKLKVVWKAWDVRSFILASFSFQIFLILISPFRKRSSRVSVRISTWIAYLLADWVAAQAVGLIAKITQVFDSAEADLFGLWAQFLLLHLGGPDTITALALEDNELWLRTALHLGTQAYATLGILVRSVRQSTLWIATVLMFFAGVIKYLERVTSLHHGRLLDIDEDAYKYMDSLLLDEQETLSNETMVRGSYWLFQAYKCLYSDIQVKPKFQNAARKYFLRRTPEEAYKMVEMQLNFTYEAMYTKMSIIHKTSWKVLRHVVLTLQVASFVIWWLWDKQHFHGYDVGITYALLIGAIGVDLVGLVRFQVSDWNVALRKRHSSSSSSSSSGGYIKKLLKTCDLVTCNASRTCRDMWSRLQNAHLSRNRWSIHIGRYDGISVITTIDRLVSCLLLRNNEAHLRRNVCFDREISNNWRFIFEMLTKPKEQQVYKLVDSDLTVDINELLLRALPINNLGYNCVLRAWFHGTSCSARDGAHNILYLTLAEYLMYLITFQPNMMFAAAGKEKVIGQLNMTTMNYSAGSTVPQEVYDTRNVDTRIDEDTFVILTPVPNPGFGKCVLELHQMKEVIKYVTDNKRSEVLDRVWGELLCHAAITCRPNIHAAKLKEGGEFLTFVWLLMLHLGIQAKTST